MDWIYKKKNKTYFFILNIMFLSIQLICFMLQDFAMAKFILETKEIIMMFNVVKKYDN